jgi:integrase
MGVYKRNGKWEVRFRIKGTVYYRQVPEAQNKSQAKLAESAMRLEIYEGRYGREAGTYDFVKFCREIYMPHLRGHASTHVNIGYKVETLCRYFKGKRLADITQIAVEGYRRRRLAGNSNMGRPRKAVTVKSEINTLSAILDLAIDNGLLGANPCRKVKFPRGSLRSQRERVLSRDEEKRLMPYLHGEVKSAVEIAPLTGLRRREIIDRRAEDFNAVSRTVTLTRKGGKLKTLPLSAAAWAAFELLIATAGSDGYLFRNRKGNNFTSRGGVFKNALDKAKITGFTFHDLRHTFASRLAEAGADSFEIRDYLGHSSVAMTDRYVQTDAEQLRAAVERVQGGEVVEFRRKTGQAFTSVSPEA